MKIRKDYDAYKAFMPECKVDIYLQDRQSNKSSSYIFKKTTETF